jgi:hypothetical protein
MLGQNKGHLQYALRAEEDRRARGHAPTSFMDKQQNQHLLDLPKVIAVGIASPAGAALTSRFGVAGTLVGLALSAVIITVVTDVLKVYLARVPGAVTTIPGGFKKRPRWQRMLYALRHPFSKFASLAPVRRRSILRGSAVAGAMAFVVGLIVVTAVEASVGKSLSCWVWNECPEAASSSDGTTASTTTSTLPSILGGSSSVRTDAPRVTPSNPQPTAPSLPPSTSPGASPTSPSSPPASSSGSETPNPSSSRSSSYQQESSSSTSESEQSTSEEYEQSSSDTSGNQQQSEYQQHSEYTQSTGKSGRGQPEAPPPLHWVTT